MTPINEIIWAMDSRVLPIEVEDHENMQWVSDDSDVRHSWCKDATVPVVVQRYGSTDPKICKITHENPKILHVPGKAVSGLPNDKGESIFGKVYFV